MVVVRIFLMGLVALVPAESPNKLTVVVPNVVALSHHSHLPVFVWDDRNSAVLGDATAIAYHLKVGAGFGGYLLGGQTITLEPMASQKLEFVGGLGKGPSRRRVAAAMPDAKQAHDFGWIPSMATLTDGKGALDERYYVSPPKRVDVAAQLKLNRTGGRVMTFGFAGDRAVPSMKFVGLGLSPVRTCRQAVADVAVIEMTYSDRELAPNQPVVFRGTGYDGGRDWSVPLLPYKADDGSQRIDVLIGNLTPMEEIGEEMTPEQTLHFDFYNGMLQKPPSYRDRLMPMTGGASMTDVDVDPPYCSLARILRVVSRGDCNKGIEPKAGIARPICMLATFAAPD